MTLRTFARFASIFVLALSVTALARPACTAGQAPEIVPGELIVGFRTALKAGITPDAAQQNLATVGQVLSVNNALRSARLKVQPGLTLAAAANVLRSRPDVAYVEPNHVVRAVATPNDPSYAAVAPAPSQYGPQKTKANLAWDLYVPKRTIVLSIVDTGVKYTHSDLADVLVRDAGNNIVGYNSLTASSNANDDYGHGTHCAGIAAAHINNGIGVAGMAGWNPAVPGSDNYVKILPVKVLDSSGSGTDETVADGIVWAADHGANVISLSLGSPDYSQLMDDACQYAVGKGCIVIAAAGNSSSSSKFYPAGITNVVSVAATDSNDNIASFSNYGTWVKVVAPGVSIYSTSYTGNYTTMSGTSMACPHVAGEAALLLAHSLTLTSTQAAELITANTDPFGVGSRTFAAGVGRINVLKAIQALDAGPPAVPTGLSATGGAAQVGLAWTAVSGAARYTVKRSTTPGGPYSQVASGITGTSYNSTGLTNGVTYYYVVSASNAMGESADSGEASATPQASILGVSVSPTIVAGGSNSTGTVTLDSPAPAGGATVTLSSNNAAASVPANVTVSGGATSATFTITTTTVPSDVTATISGLYRGVTKNAALLVQGPVSAVSLTGLTLTPTAATGGANVTGKVTLSAAAPAGGTVVTLASNNAAASVPATVTVPAGATTATFTVTTSAVNASTSVTISATLSGVTKTAVLQVRAPYISALTLTPTSVTAGNTSTGKITLAGPAGSSGFLVNLSSSNPGVASPPASATVPSGATTVTFLVSTGSVMGSTNVDISGIPAGETRVSKATLTVTPGGPPSPPAAPTGLTATGGAAQVALSWNAVSGATSYNVKRSTTSGGPYSGVASGLSNPTYTDTGLTNGVTYFYVVSASNTGGEGSNSAQASATPQANLTSLSLSPTSVTGGAISTGTVTLDSAAPSGGAVVTLSSNNAAATVPASVTVAGGATSATFTVTTSAVGADVTATITGACGPSKSAMLTVQAPPPSPALAGVSVSPTSVIGGGSVTGTVTLSLAAPAGGITVNLSSDNAAASVPASVTVVAGSTTATFTVSTSAVAADVTANITGSYDGVSKSAALTVQAPAPPSDVALVSLTLSTTAVAGGTNVTGKVTLSAAAPSGGTVVTLSSNNAAASVPATVTVPAGATTATFTVTTSPVSSAVTATISAALGGVTKTATLQVRAPYISVLSLTPSTVVGGTSSTGKITLSGPAPSGGFTVNLTSSNTAAATVQASVTVPAGATIVTFPVSTKVVGANTVVDITGTPVGETRISKGTLSVTP